MLAAGTTAAQLATNATLRMEYESVISTVLGTGAGSTTINSVAAPSSSTSTPAASGRRMLLGCASLQRALA